MSIATSSSLRKGCAEIIAVFLGPSAPRGRDPRQQPGHELKKVATRLLANDSAAIPDARFVSIPRWGSLAAIKIALYQE